MSVTPEFDIEVFFMSAFPPAQQVNDLRFVARAVEQAQDAKPESDLSYLAPKRYNRPTQGEVTKS